MPVPSQTQNASSKKGSAQASGSKGSAQASGSKGSAQASGTDKAQDLAHARHVLEAEAAALTALAADLNDHFPRAVETLIACKGRVIVSGMGKSGHIARKIAATLASTGTPSQFVHPAEASHGDLGMVTRHDAVIALSWSGEAAELSDLVAHTRRFGIPLIAMTGKAQSTLARACDILLLLPDRPEVCPLGLAPTTSTTMMMALGDALAVAAIERRGFGVDDFRQLHPGGKLGRALLKVSDLMHDSENLPIVALESPMPDVLKVIGEKHFGCTGVVDEAGRLAGMITDGDLRRHMGTIDLAKTRARDLMTANPVTIGPDLLAVAAIKLMNEREQGPITMLFVVDAQGQPVGFLHIHDLLRVGLA